MSGLPDKVVIMLSRAYNEGFDTGTGHRPAGPNPYEYGTNDFHYFAQGYQDGKQAAAKASKEMCEFFGIK